MKKLAAFYFSGTGNTLYVTNRLCQRLSGHYETEVIDICGREARQKLGTAKLVMLAFPVYGSSPPLPMRRFVSDNADLIAGKDFIVICTQYMFSGDGAASLGRTVEKSGGRVLFAEHFRMPDNLSDFPLLPVKNGEALTALIKKTDKRIDNFAAAILSSKYRRRGFNPVSQAVGYLCQRALWRRSERQKQNNLNIDGGRCIGCGACVKSCPVHNLRLESGKAVPAGKCALCYRCVNLCPEKAIKLVGKHPPKEQYAGPPVPPERK